MMKILIADDNASMRKLLENIVTRLGTFDIDYAGTGNEALRAFNNKHHDLILLDNMMPTKSGLDVLRHLKNDEHLKNCHVIMITGIIDRNLVETIKNEKLKIDDLLLKPIDIKRLEEKILHLYAKHKRLNSDHGPVLNEGIKEEIIIKPQFKSIVINRGNISIVELTGSFFHEHRDEISMTIEELKTIHSPTVVIDINRVNEMDNSGYGLLVILIGVLVLQKKDVFISCDDCTMKERITSLGIYKLVNEFSGSLK